MATVQAGSSTDRPYAMMAALRLALSPRKPPLGFQKTQLTSESRTSVLASDRAIDAMGL